MNAQFINQSIAATRLVQGITGEPITINGTNYTCTASSMVTGNPEFVAGGTINKLAITVTLLQADYPSAPAIDTLAVFRGYNFRAISVEDAAISWQVQLVQEQA